MILVNYFPIKRLLNYLKLSHKRKFLWAVRDSNPRSLEGVRFTPYKNHFVGREGLEPPKPEGA